MTDMDRYVEACNYPGTLDEAKVAKALTAYCQSIGAKHQVKRLSYPWWRDDNLWLTIFEVAGAAREAREAIAAAVLLSCFGNWCILRSGYWYYTWELSWLATTYLGTKSLRTESRIAWAKPIFDAYLAGAWQLFWTEGTLYWIAKPTIRRDAAKRLHSDKSAACENDVENLYFLHGVRVPAYAVVDPSQITAKEIETETNAEVRRVLIERYGFEKYLEDAKIKQIQQDDFGRLYRKEIPGEPAMQFVRVVNSTPEPDGTFKEYVLPVRNTAKSAHQAVAESFELTVDAYRPCFES